MFCHAINGSIHASALSICLWVLTDFAYPIRTALRRQSEIHKCQDFHDGGECRLSTVFAPRNDNARHLIEKGTAAAMDIFFIERIHPFDDSLHEARASAPPYRGNEEDYMRSLDLLDDRRPFIIITFSESKTDRYLLIRETDFFDGKKAVFLHMSKDHFCNLLGI